MVVAALKEALLAGVLALLLFGPITGLVLTGYAVESHWQRPLLLAGVVMVGRFLMVLAFRRDTPWGGWLKAHLGRRELGAVVVSGQDRSRQRLALLLFLVALPLPFLLGNYWLNVAILALIYVLLGMGLNIVVGLAGLLDLGYVAFYAVGAYTCALGSHYFGLSFWETLPLGALLAACFGAVLGFPVLRMHGDYLAIVTLGFGEIIRLVLNNWMSVTGGPNGMKAVFPTFFGLEFSRTVPPGAMAFHEFVGLDYSRNHRYIFLYFMLLLVVAAMVYVVTRLKNMPMGRAWEALREDEIACRSLGINHVAVKLSAFSMGAMVGGLGGVFFAASQGFVNPTSFTFFESALILAVVVLGGMGSTTGVVAAAVVLTVLPELMREFASYRVLGFGLAMVLMMVWRPRGLVRPRRPAFGKG